MPSGKPKIRLAILEDEPITAMFMEQTLMAEGYLVTGIYNKGEKFLNEEFTELPDLIFMDIKLKGEMDGIEVLRQIRQRNWQFPVIFTTGNSDKHTVEQLKSRQENHFLFKPFLQEDLLAKVRLVLRESKSSEKKKN